MAFPLNLPIYRQYPEMAPAIGACYAHPAHSKLLLVGEIFYLPEGSSAHLDPVKWYAGDHRALTEEERAWICTESVIDSQNPQMIKSLTSALSETAQSTNPAAEIWRHVAYMNFSLRPAPCKKSFKDIATPVDVQKSCENLVAVLKILKPDILVLCSKYVCDCAESGAFRLWEYTEPMGIKYVYVNHPAQPCWNQVINPRYFHNQTSRDFFLSFLKENWAKDLF